MEGLVPPANNPTDRVAVGDEGYLLEIDQDWRLDDDDVFFYTDQFLVNVKLTNRICSTFEQNDVAP